MKKPDSPTKISLLSTLCCALALNGCTRDDSPGAGDAWSCNLPPRVDAEGVTQWSWRLQWWGNGDLAAACASYGTGAKMVMEVDVPTNPRASSTLPDCATDEVLSGATRACVIAGAYRFEADCAAGELRFELPSENTFHGYYHIEGAAVVKTMRYLLGQNVECSRQVFTRTGVSAAPTAPDGGPPPQDAGDGSTCMLVYDEPGCGTGANPVCSTPVDVPMLYPYYCACNGKTIEGVHGGSLEPYQFMGCCPGDTGFGWMGSYSCPWDGGVPYLTPKNDGGASASSDAAVEAGVSSSVDTNVVPDVPIDATPSDASDAAPDAAVCDQLAAAAQTQVVSYLASTYSLACQVDADCSFFEPRSLSCFAVCGNVVVRTADLSAITAAAGGACEAYFGAGCPEKTPPCPYAVPVCDHGTCVRGPVPGGPSGSIDGGSG